MCVCVCVFVCLCVCPQVRVHIPTCLLRYTHTHTHTAHIQHSAETAHTTLNERTTVTIWHGTTCACNVHGIQSILTDVSLSTYVACVCVCVCVCVIRKVYLLTVKLDPLPPARTHARTHTGPRTAVYIGPDQMGNVDTISSILIIGPIYI